METTRRGLAALTTERCIGDVVSLFAGQHMHRNRYLGQTRPGMYLSPGLVLARAILAMPLQRSLPETLYANAGSRAFALVPEHALAVWNFDFLCDCLRQFFPLSSMGCIKPRSQVCHYFLCILDLRNAGQNELPLSEIEFEMSGRDAHNAAVDWANMGQAVQRVTAPIRFEVVIIKLEDPPPPVCTRGY